MVYNKNYEKKQKEKSTIDKYYKNREEKRLDTNFLENNYIT